MTKPAGWLRPWTPSWLLRRIDRHLAKQARVKWGANHRGLIFGRNGFGQLFCLQQMSYEPPDRRWHLYERLRCPEGRVACTCADRLLWTGTDPEVGKTRAHIHSAPPPRERTA